MPKVSAAHLKARRRQIVEAAIECFSREGFHQTTMQDIVRESGLSPGAIYTYFASKHEIIEEIAKERHAWERGLIAKAGGEDEGVTSLHSLSQAFFGALLDAEERKRRRLGVQLWAEALRDPRILDLVRRGVDEPRVMLARLVSAAQRRGELVASLDPDAVARVLIALFQGFVLQQAWDEASDVEPYRQAIETIFDSLRQEKDRPKTG